MLTRRHFLRNLALAVGVLTLKLRSEPVPSVAAPEEFLGFRGRSFLAAGVVYAPYMPLYVVTPHSLPAYLGPFQRRVFGRKDVLHPAEIIRQAKFGGYEKYL